MPPSILSAQSSIMMPPSAVSTHTTLVTCDLSTTLNAYATVSRLHTLLTSMQFSPPVLYDEVANTVRAMYDDHDLNTGISRAQDWGAAYLSALPSSNSPSLSEFVTAHSEV